jgi:hypothetical protein
LLAGGRAFDVSPFGPQQQLISKQQVTTWTWLVTPKQVARPRFQLSLFLSFDAVLTVDGIDGTQNIHTFGRQIVPTILVPARLWLFYGRSRRLRSAKGYSLLGMAAELSRRKIATPRGGRWSAALPGHSCAACAHAREKSLRNLARAPRGRREERWSRAGPQPKASGSGCSKTRTGS